MENDKTTDHSAILQIENLTKTVVQNSRPKNIVSDFTFTFHNPGIYNILGPSGAGKSSLLRLFCRLDEPTGGLITFRGDDYRNHHPGDLRKQIGYLFQTPHLFPGTVKENFLFALPGIENDKINMLLQKTGLNPDIAGEDTENLSVGERQRVCIARLLALGPLVVLLDEPTSAIDPANKYLIEEVIRKLYTDNNITVIMVSHDPQQALRMSGKTLLIVDGRLAECGDSQQLINEPRTELGRLYKDMKLR